MQEWQYLWYFHTNLFVQCICNRQKNCNKTISPTFKNLVKKYIEASLLPKVILNLQLVESWN